MQVTMDGQNINFVLRPGSELQASTIEAQKKATEQGAPTKVCWATACAGACCMPSTLTPCAPWGCFGQTSGQTCVDWP